MGKSFRPRDATRRRLGAGAVALVAVLGGEHLAAAQTRWDASVMIGVGKRFLTDAYAQPGFGPAATVVGHVAVIPLLRVGPYLAYDASPLGDGPSRRFYSLGARAKIQAPWATARVHGWGFVGAGYTAVYGPSEERTLSVASLGEVATGPKVPTPVSVGGAGGGLVEIPVGVGIGYRLRRPWEVLFELSGRFGFGFGGSLYRGRDAVSDVNGTQVLAPVGRDTVGLFLTGGIGLDL